jgi:NTE family protein
MDSQIRADGLYFLKRNSLFSPLGEEVLLELVTALRALQSPKGATLLREGDPGDGLYLIKSGRVRIVSKTEKGEEKTMAYLGRGDAVGELALLTGEPHAFSVMTDTTCEFLVLGKKEFDAVLETHPLIGIHLSRALSKRLAVSFHPPQDKPKQPQLLALVPGLPYEAMLLSTINLCIALVEQTRRKVVLVDFSLRSGDIARALGLHAPLSNEEVLKEQEFLDHSTLKRLITMHPSGLEILSLHPKWLKENLHGSVPALLGILKDHYDFTLVLGPVEKDPLSRILVREADKILLTLWDQAQDLAMPTRDILQENLSGAPTPITTIFLQHPSSAGTTPADFRVPWSEMFHQPLRDSGSPYLSSSNAGPAITALDRIARALGKLRVGIAMGSGAAYGYGLIGMLKVFEREGIPIDMVSGTSMGSLLGSFYCAGNSPERIREIAQSITKRWLFENIFGDLTFPHSGFMAGQTLNAFLRSVLGNVEFDQLLIPFAAVATDIRSGHEVVLREGRVVDAVRASTSLPILFRPFLHKGRFLVDGGLINPVPTSTVAAMGADILVSVNLTAQPSVRRGLGRNRRAFPLGPRSPSMMEVFFKMIYTMQYEIAQARTEIAHVVIAPDMREFLWTDLHRSEEIMKVGEAAAEEAVAKIKSLLPFFSDYCKVPLGISLRAY